MKTLLIVLASIAALIGAWALLGFLRIVDFPPLGLRVLSPENAFDASLDTTADFPPDNDLLDAVLSDAVTDNGVIYDRLVENERLETYVSSLEHHGPRTFPDEFAGGQDKFAYYINAYNAFVIYGVASNWPIQSVHDVRSWVAVHEGFGFFYGLRFKLDGQTVNLHELEHEILRKQFHDARVHAAINCASRSCPPLRNRAYRSEDLDATLTEVTREWVDSPTTFEIDHTEQKIRLNAIFSWFSEDFERDARSFDEQDTVLGWIEHFLTPAKAGALKDAQDNGYDVTYADYDWSINKAE